MNVAAGTDRIGENKEMHKVFGWKENVFYTDRRGAYLIPVKDGQIGVVRTGRGYFLLGGGLENDECDEGCIARECMEEIGYRVLVKSKIGSAEAYYRSPEIGYFHPIQTYYAGELTEKVREASEDDHLLVWRRFEELRGKMYLDMQNWAVEVYWNSGEA